MSKWLACLIVFGVLACSRGDDAASGSETMLVLPAGWSLVSDRSQVCMINDEFMGRAQIPVVVNGRTYYGCCAACKQKLEDVPANRLARDPVSGEAVDKARAVIVKNATGKVLYFESETTLRRYRG